MAFNLLKNVAKKLIFNHLKKGGIYVINKMD